MHPDCPRCGGSLQPVDGEPPAFCPHCGLQQLRISEDALLHPSAPEHRGAARAVDGAEVDWPLALRLILSASAIGVVLPSLLPGALAGGLVAGLSVLMTPVLTLAMTLTYGRRRVLSGTVGARMGALLGCVMGCLIAFFTGVAGFVLRYHNHSHAMDDRIQQALSQVPAQMSGAGQPASPGVLALLQTPEFRAGTFLAGNLFSLLLLVLAGTVCGWLAAAMLRTRRPADE